MLSEISAKQVYLACGSTDLRKSIDGLTVLVREGFNFDPFAPCLFAFCNRQRNKLKILRWDHNGFWLYYRRLERGTFQWPAEPGQLHGVLVFANFAGCSTASRWSSVKLIVRSRLASSFDMKRECSRICHLFHKDITE